MRRIPQMEGIYKVTVKFPDSSKEPNLELDFEPIISNFHLYKIKQFVLCHWQSRPKGVRGFGFYDWYSKTYHCIDWNRILISKATSKPIQLDETQFQSTPTAVLYYPNCRLIQQSENAWIIQ